MEDDDMSDKANEITREAAEGGVGGIEAEAAQAPGSAPRQVRSCNRHTDCDAADARVRAQGRFLWADHCDDEFCEDCFGT